jgi:hypothetical protein
MSSIWQWSGSPDSERQVSFIIALPPTFCGRKFSTPIRTASIVALINAFMMLEVRRTSRNGTEKRTGKKAKFVRESPRRSTTNSAKAKRNPVR